MILLSKIDTKERNILGLGFRPDRANIGNAKLKIVMSSFSWYDTWQQYIYSTQNHVDKRF